MSASQAETKQDTEIVTVESISHDGRGVTHINGKAVFIEGALPNERVRLHIYKRQRRYDLARLVEVINPSPDRREPPCPHFGVCGGCSLQHVTPSAQIRDKQIVLAEQLKRIGKVEPQHWLEPIVGPEWGYRRRARLGARLVEKKGGVLVGFRERQRSHITDLSTCLVLEPVVASWLPELRKLITALSCPDRVPQIEVAVGDRARALVFRHLVPFTPKDEQLLRAFGEKHDAQIYAQAGSPEDIVALWPGNPAPLDYTLFDGTVLQFRPSNFIQVNAAINNKMIEQALRLLDPQPTDTVLDLFSGLGNFTLPLARRTKHVLGIEGEMALVEGARANAERNGIRNTEFRAANLFDETAHVTPWHDVPFNKLLLDPPRSGAIEAIKALRAPLPDKIVYVSCYPGTLARDSDYLVHVLGYRLVSAGVMDMFPHTNHVESMALFERP